MKTVWTAKRGLLAWMVNNGVAANLLMVILVVGGMIAASKITQEVYPEYDLDIVTVTVAYSGATPEEVEEGVVLAIEEEIRALEAIERVTAVANEGRATITAELYADADSDRALQDIKSAVDRISSLPEDAERPLIALQTRRREVLRLALYGDLTEPVLFDLGDKVREELLDLPAITQVELRGVRDPELAVEVPAQVLRAHGLTLGGIAETIRGQAADIPAGSIKAAGGEILLRTAERRDFAEEFAAIAVVSRPDGTSVLLGDIASVREGYTETDREAWYNGQRAVLVYVYRTGEQTPQSVSDAVHGYVERLAAGLPAGVSATIYNDRSEQYRDRLDLLLFNGSFGLLLVLVTLGLFLEPRLAFWVAMGVPISVIGSFLVLYFIGGSINMVSMFAFIITLGIVVDDAVVVGENIFHHRQDTTLTPRAASIAGVREMAAPIFVAVATNIIAFLPLLFVSGSTGRFFSILPAVVIAVFTISYVECLLVLPSHLSYERNGAQGGFLRLMNRVPALFGRLLDWFTTRCFAPVLAFCLRSRYLVALFAMALVAVSYTYWDNGYIDFSFRPGIQTDSVEAQVELPYGTSFAEVRRITRLVEAGGMRTVEKFGGRAVVVGMMSDIGRDGGNVAEVAITLVPQKDRSFSTRDFSVAWRAEVGDIAGLERLFFDYLVGPGGAAAINVELSHPDPATLEQAADELAGSLADYAGVTDIDNGFARGKPQLDFTLTPEGLAAGLTARDLGGQVRASFHGAEAVRQQRGRDELRVMVRLPAAERQSRFDLEELMLRTPDGGEMPLAQAADTRENRAYTEINRVDGKRVLNVTANVVPGQANENKILATLKADTLPDFLAQYPGLGYSFAGRQREQRQAVADLAAGIGYALPGIFALLAVLFGSYGLSLLVMASIPFGLISALAGHLVMGYDLSIISIFGMIALCGVVVNGGLVFVVTARRLRDEGVPAMEAAAQAAVRRLRPILLTSLTTFCGLAPMIFEQSVQARFLVPMAISLGYGILFSTVFVLLLTPVLFAVYHDIRAWWKSS